MDEDVEMDAPQISILREEVSPPPQRKTPSSRKSKSTPKAKPAEFPFLSRPRKESLSDDEYDEPEEEEDQLIDDDDDELNKPTPSQTPVKPTDAGQKRKAPSKRKPRKAEKKAEEDKKVKEKQPLQPISQMNIGTPETEPPQQPDTTRDDAVVRDVHSNVPQDMPTEPTPALMPPVPSKKKASPRKPPAAPRQRAKVTNDKVKLKITIRPMLPPEDIEVASEGGHTGTAASSPIATLIEPIDLHDLDLDHPAPAPSIPTPEEPICLENVPIPIYPLPTKPFPVQPAPKINTGAAPTIPLDKSGKKVRHWRLAHREIRGIAGGRWFARTWVGGRESQLAAHIAAVGKEGDDRPTKGSSASAPVAGKGSARARGSKNASLAASTSASAAPSRDGSLGPDAPISISTVRAPTKMRMTLGPNEYVD